MGSAATWRPRTRGRALAAALAVCLGLAAGPVAAYETRRPDPDPHAVQKSYDLVVLRPLGLVQLVVGSALVPVFYPVARPFGGGDHVIDYFVMDPVDRTFRRPLGRL